MPLFGRKTRAVAQPGRPRRPGPPPLLARSGRFALVVFCVTGAFVGIAFRLWWLQYYTARDLADEADKLRRLTTSFSAERGQIRDSRGTVLAKAKEVWDIVADPFDFTPKDNENIDRIADDLSRIIHVPASKLAEIFRRKFRDEGETGGEDDSTDSVAALELPDAPKARPIKWVKLAEGVSMETRDKVLEAMARYGMKNIRPDRRFEREYPYGKLAAQVVGYVNKEGRPAMGIEKAFDFFLKGEDGWIDSQRNGKKREDAGRRIREIAPRDGNSVVLTIDATIQQAAEEELGKACEAYHPEWGIAIVSEAKTGRILALTNWPTFDLNEYNDLKKSPLEAQKNRAVTDIYEPGSVFKIVSYSAAFQEGVINADTQFDCGPNHRAPFYAPYKGALYKLADDDEDLGRVDVRKAIAKSSNRAAAQIAMRVAEVKGVERLWQYMADFGFGAPTGLVTGSEVRGLLLKPNQWQWSTRAATITQVPMGHSVSVTALQTHFAMGVIASGGDLLAPQLVSRIVDKDGLTVHEFDPVVRKHTLTKETASRIAELLRGVVTDGTGKKAAIAGYEVAGKTGTTEMLVKDPATGRTVYSKTRNVASFCGFFPSRDPKVVVSVIMADPHGNGRSFGGTYSAPVFKSISERVIKWLKIPAPNQQEADDAESKARKKAGLPPLRPAAPSPGLFSPDAL